MVNWKFLWECDGLPPLFLLPVPSNRYLRRRGRHFSGPPGPPIALHGLGTALPVEEGSASPKYPRPLPNNLGPPQVM